MTARGGRRLGRFALLVLAGLGVTAATGPLAPHGVRIAWLSLGTAYAGLVLLAASLLIGPWQVLRHGTRLPPSSTLRRDIGIAAAGFGLAHVVFGLQVHLGDMLAYFLRRLPGGGVVPRFDVFGLTNWLGLLAALLLLLLLGLSNNASLRRLKAAPWKRLQRSSYALALLVLVHGALYQVLERRSWAGILLLGALAAIPALAQGLGYARVRRMRSVPG